jgi:uncharacterized membrane-anchored protein
MKKLAQIGVIVVSLFPVIAFAQLDGVMRLIQNLGIILDILTVLVVGIALLVFFWGLVRFIFRIGGDEKAIEEGRKLMIWGVIALFVMMSVWGLTNFIYRNLIPGESLLAPPIPLLQNR